MKYTLTPLALLIGVAIASDSPRSSHSDSDTGGAAAAQAAAGALAGAVGTPFDRVVTSGEKKEISHLGKPAEPADGAAAPQASPASLVAGGEAAAKAAKKLGDELAEETWNQIVNLADKAPNFISAYYLLEERDFMKLTRYPRDYRYITVDGRKYMAIFEERGVENTSLNGWLKRNFIPTGQIIPVKEKIVVYNTYNFAPKYDSYAKGVIDRGKVTVLVLAIDRDQYRDEDKSRKKLKERIDLVKSEAVKLSLAEKQEASRKHFDDEQNKMLGNLREFDEGFKTTFSKEAFDANLARLNLDPNFNKLYSLIPISQERYWEVNSSEKIEIDEKKYRIVETEEAREKNKYMPTGEVSEIKPGYRKIMGGYRVSGKLMILKEIP